MYLISYLEEDTENEVSIEKNHSVLVYNSSKDAYTSFISDLEDILRRYNITGEKIDDTVIDTLVADCREKYFKGVILPPCKFGHRSNTKVFCVQWESTDFHTNR